MHLAQQVSRTSVVMLQWWLAEVRADFFALEPLRELIDVPVSDQDGLQNREDRVTVCLRPGGVAAVLFSKPLVGSRGRAGLIYSQNEADPLSCSLCSCSVHRR